MMKTLNFTTIIYKHISFELITQLNSYLNLADVYTNKTYRHQKAISNLMKLSS